ncbi:MAG: redoxin domain-containing protein [Sedimentisphaerales bacterium]|nr:redoxin domain-containing protein [Sedimentisphaerales bacterium]
MYMRRILHVVVVLLACVGNGSLAQQAEPMVCKGTVVDREGKPIPNARVALYHNCSRWRLGNRVAQETTTGLDGSFAFPQPVRYCGPSEYAYGRDTYILLAVHPDCALAWCSIARGQEKPSYELVLTEPQSQTVTVTDHEGNPLAGVRVWPYALGDPAGSEALFRETFFVSTDPGLVGGTTGADGKAVVTNLPRTRCSFHADLKGYAQGLTFSASHTIRLNKGATVAGSVRNEEGQPVKDAVVRFHTNWGLWQFFLAQTDALGRFRLEDIPAEGWDMSPWGQPVGGSGIYIITMEHDDYVAAETQDQFEPGEVVEDFAIEACRGTLVKCRVVQTSTGRPLAGARIQGSNELARIDGRSDANGVLTFRVLPGRVSLFFTSPPEGVYTLRDDDQRSMQFQAQGDEMTVTLRAPDVAGRLTSVRGQVQLPDGTPAAEVKLFTTNSAFYNTSTWSGAGGAYTATNPDGTFELTEVPEELRLFIYGRTKDSQYILAETIDSVMAPTVLSAPLVMRAGQTAELPLTDRRGNPCANMEITVSPRMWGNHIPRADDLRGATDAEGCLKVDGIIPGMEYFLMDAKGSRSERDWPDKYYHDQLVLIPLVKQEPTRVSFDGIDIDFRPEQAEGKMILVCFWDMQQRPARNCLLQLAQQADRLRDRNVTLVAVHVSPTDDEALRRWLDQNEIGLPIGTIAGDVEAVRQAWGVKALPWLVLTDGDHVVRAEGFALDEWEAVVQRVEDRQTR